MTDFFSRRDLDFQLQLQGLPELLAWPRYAAHDAGSCAAMVDLAFQVAHDEFLPHAAKADAHEPHFDGERVHQIPEVRQALDAYFAAGFQTAGLPEAEGGMQLPVLLCTAVHAVFSAANIGTCGYPFLTGAAANLLRAHGSDDQKRRFLPPMLAGRWFGTMCLSEPQAGSSLADIRTRAIPRADGRYDIRGSKMWISGGEHDLSENIVHMVLARIDGAPAGVKGISLFIVPKRSVDADGNAGARNGVRLIGLNHKMGYRAITNTALAFGDGADCVGELVGEPHRGLACMFHMMNEARIGVGIGAVALGYAGYRHALDYAKGRPQGRPVAGRDPLAPPVPIVEHADVKRLLLAQKAYVEGGLALGLYGARLVDQQLADPDPARRAQASALLDLLTPVIKAWPAEWCLEANKLAIQVLGGYGYTRDYPVERLYRDNRLNPIHEGTNGIQGLDLLGRKVLVDGGRALRVLLGLAQADALAAPKPLAGHAEALSEACDRIVQTTAALGGAAAAGRLELALANSNAYLELVGHTVVAWLWLRQAALAQQALDAGAAGEERAFHEGKLAACRYFFLYELPKTAQHAELLQRLDATLLQLSASQL